MGAGLGRGRGEPRGEKWGQLQLSNKNKKTKSFIKSLSITTKNGSIKCSTITLLYFFYAFNAMYLRLVFKEEKLIVKWK